MTKKKILITGSNGFVGKSLKEYFLADGGRAEIITPLRGELNLLDSDAVKSFMVPVRPDAVIHCATTGGTRKTGYDIGSTDVVARNLRMFFNIARCLKPGMRMIQLGSGAEYDKHYYIPKMSEDYFDTHVPADDYGYAKYVISKYIEKTDNIICLRIFGIYGKYEDYTYKFISNAIVKNLLNMPIVINQNVIFDFLWIEDFCKIVEMLLKIKLKYKHYNITPTRSIDLVSLAEIINSVSMVKSEIKLLHPGMNREYTGNNSRLLDELKGFNFTSYVTGVKQLYSYYFANLQGLDLETVKKDPYLKSCKKSDD